MRIEVNRSPIIENGYYIEEYRLINNNGFELHVSNFGCTLLAILWPKEQGGKDDILLGYDTVEQWLDDQSFFGSTAGRCCNRIRGAVAQIDGLEYSLSANIPPHHLHGGWNGFNKKTWRGTPAVHGQTASITMHYLSGHLEEGYPGNLAATAVISLNEDQEITIQYSAITDQATICNLTNHGYFNLDGSKDILDHELWINAHAITGVDQDLVPTGEIIPISNTPFDFTTPSFLRSKIGADHDFLHIAKGYDHNYILSSPGDNTPQAILKSLINGRKISVYTDQPGIQVYSGNHLNLNGKEGKAYGPYAGLCLETQGFPNAANIDSFPSVILEPGEVYGSYTMLKLEE